MEKVVEVYLRELEDTLRGDERLAPEQMEERKQFCADRIKAICESLKRSPAGLGDAIGVSPATIYRWIGGKSVPRFSNIVSLGQFAAGKSVTPDFSTKGGGHRIDIGIFVKSDTASAIDLLNILKEQVAKHPGGAFITDAELK